MKPMDFQCTSRLCISYLRDYRMQKLERQRGKHIVLLSILYIATINHIISITQPINKTRSTVRLGIDYDIVLSIMVTSRCWFY